MYLGMGMVYKHNGQYVTAKNLMRTVKIYALEKKLGGNDCMLALYMKQSTPSTGLVLVG